MKATKTPRREVFVPPSSFILPTKGCSMRIGLLCSVALLCVGALAQAQTWPAQQGYYGPYPGGYYGGGYPQMGPGAYANGYYQFLQSQQQPCPIAPTGKPIPPPAEEPEPKKDSWCWTALGYSFAFIRSPADNVPLVSTSNQVVARAGALDVPGTSVLLGTNTSFDTFSAI